ncbi:MAG TPA: hypothetical protein VHV32_03845 [Candidatus Angelobacter sp.]|nr:hypothetical protein [Candidatus Angelobacter sp.]
MTSPEDNLTIIVLTNTEVQNAYAITQALAVQSLDHLRSRC